MGGGLLRLRWVRLQRETLQIAGLLLNGQINPKQRIRPGWPESDLPGRQASRIVVDCTIDQHAAGRLQNQLSGATAGPIANLDIGAAFEPVGGFGAQVQLFGSSADVARLETGALEQD